MFGVSTLHSINHFIVIGTTHSISLVWRWLNQWATFALENKTIGQDLALSWSGVHFWKVTIDTHWERKEIPCILKFRPTLIPTLTSSVGLVHTGRHRVQALTLRSALNVNTCINTGSNDPTWLVWPKALPTSYQFLYQVYTCLIQDKNQSWTIPEPGKYVQVRLTLV